MVPSRGVSLCRFADRKLFSSRHPRAPEQQTFPPLSAAGRPSHISATQVRPSSSLAHGPKPGTPTVLISSHTNQAPHVAKRHTRTTRHRFPDKHSQPRALQLPAGQIVLPSLVRTLSGSAFCAADWLAVREFRDSRCAGRVTGTSDSANQEPAWVEGGRKDTSNLCRRKPSPLPANQSLRHESRTQNRQSRGNRRACGKPLDAPRKGSS